MQLKTSLSRHLIPVSNMAGTCSRWPFVSNDSCLSYIYCNLYSLHLMRAKTKETFTALVIIGYLSVYDRIVVCTGRGFGTKCHQVENCSNGTDAFSRYKWIMYGTLYYG